MTTTNPLTSSFAPEPLFSMQAVFADYAGTDAGRWQRLLGRSVLHSTFGYGVVISADAASVVVEFDDRPTEHRKRVPFHSPTSFESRQLADQQVFLEVDVPAELLADLDQHRLGMIRRTRINWCHNWIEEQRRSVDDVALAVIKTMQAAKQLTPHLDSDDIRLVLRWDDFTEPDLVHLSSREELVKLMQIDAFAEHQELARVLSARAAEKAVIQFYRRLGHDVVDKSITQLEDHANGAWRDYDLLVDGCPVDVKNARTIVKRRGRWTNRPITTYVEHCVPRHKKVEHGEDVAIGAVLSSRLQTRSLIDPENAPAAVPKEVTFLGTTTLATLSALQEHFVVPGFFEIDWTRAQNGAVRFLPPWLFDYPSSAYQFRDQYLASLAQSFLEQHDLFQCAREVFDIPLALTVGVSVFDHDSRDHMAPWQIDFAKRVMRWRMQHGLSLPFLFLTVLSHFLEVATSNRDASLSFRPSDYRSLLYPTHADRDYLPLLIYDPLLTVSNLVDTLDALWMADHEFIRDFNSFKLQGLRILKGRRRNDPSNRWLTLIAYCGNGKCQEAPLVLGECQLCQTCGRLICPNGFCRLCSENCPEYMARSKEQSHSLSSGSGHDCELSEIPF